ncbi:N-acylglucosamine 2-epimerase-like [Littorina saxatilis]|uniref:N-acylglucosamine 2-epimerase n=1 Tax=Littorina saxatilis TaxID=31220 RepID=A0AAN9BBR9_9CAEN
MEDPEHRLGEFLEKIRADLDRSVCFWLTHSHDVQCGGFFICLGEDGHVYDETKYTWLEARQVWMYARLYNEVDRFKTAEMLEAAENGGKFVLAHMKRQDTGKCYLSLTRQGLPLKTQRTIFSECFYLMAMSELHRATGDAQYREEAVAMMSRILCWVLEDDSGLGREKLAGNTPVSSLAVPMMLLCLIDQLTTMDPALAANYDETEQWCLEEVNKHVQRNGTVVLENVTPDGKELPGSAGRLMTPGHAIEAGWFLLQIAKTKGDKTLQTLAIDTFITTSFSRGWDPEFGGLFYFVDADGESPVQLEWDMKLWWAHNETMIAMLMAYTETGDTKLLANFATVFDYSYSHFVDTAHGDWYGYLNRRGEITHKFKGGPWKGFFHLPRCLMMCEKMLEDLIKRKQ